MKSGSRTSESLNKGIISILVQDEHGMHRTEIEVFWGDLNFLSVVERTVMRRLELYHNRFMRMVFISNHFEFELRSTRKLPPGI